MKTDKKSIINNVLQQLMHKGPESLTSPEFLDKLKKNNDVKSVEITIRGGMSEEPEEEMEEGEMENEKPVMPSLMRRLKEKARKEK
jgi:hypothetical protein